jgi:hypothetical protein
MPSQGLRPDQDEVASPVPLEAADEEPKELVPSPKAWTMPGAEGDLELRTKEQVLDEEALAPAEDAGGVARTSSRSSIIGGQDRRSMLARGEERRLLPSYNPRWTSAAVTYFSRQR